LSVTEAEGPVDGSGAQVLPQGSPMFGKREDDKEHLLGTKHE